MAETSIHPDSAIRVLVLAKKAAMCPRRSDFTRRCRWAAVLLAAVFAAAACFTPSLRAVPPQEVAGSAVRLEPSPQLFATLCALYAAGFDPGNVPLPADSPFAALRKNLAALNGPATQALREFYRSRVLSDPTTTLSRFITFATIAGPPPRFTPVLRPEELPPDALALQGFDEILANFYAEAGIETAWRVFQAHYERAAEPLREPLAQVVLTATGYLREIVPPAPRTFAVYVEPLVGSQTHVRNVLEHYVVVVNPEIRAVEEIRHAFLHFLIDPLPLRYSDSISRAAVLLPLAARAPRLPAELRNDFPGFFAECLVRAVELRLRRLPPGQLASEVDAAEAEGFVLVRPLLSSLAQFEMAEPAMSYYFPDLAASLDVQAEARRLQTVTFASASNSPVPSRDVASAAGAVPVREADLAEGERLIAERDAPGAAAAFERVLARTPGHPRALYGLAVASVLQGDASRARNLFEQVVGAAATGSPQRPDPATLSWSHIYLGRMYDLQGDREQALREYRAALAVPGVPETARAAAERGIEQGYQPVRADSPG